MYGQATFQPPSQFSYLGTFLFEQLFAPVFEREAHFCSTVPESQVPTLGTMDSTKAEVESFYDFWYNFDSWRTFEWHDKEMNEGSNRWA